MSEEPSPNWALWPDAHEVASVLTTSELWGVRVGELLMPSSGSRRWVAIQELRPVGERSWSTDEISWRAGACRAIYAMAHGRPLALTQARLEPLPHQIGVLRRAMELDQVRLLLADEVGLGKTIEAGLIAKELALRGRIKRVLVVAPKGVQLQWVAEMRNRFDEEFARVGPGGIPVDAGINPWRAFDRIVCSLDAVKPVRRRAGWSLDRLDAYNQERFQAVVEAGWDLVIIDEAHHVAGSTDEIARHELARELSANADHLLMLSATPHSGKTESFQRLLGLIDPTIADGPLEREAVRAVVVRNEKRSAVGADGRPLFQPRTTQLRVAPYEERTIERALYSAVTDYVRDGYKRALKDRRPAVGFLMLLMQRLVSSSTAAIRTALEKRLAALTTDGGQLALFAEGAERWAELSGEEQYEALASAQGAASGDERREVEILLDLARKAAGTGVDAKATYLLDLLRECQRDEGNPSLKFVVFTEFVPTQEMLLDVLERAGISATSINGTMSIDERALAQETFERDCQILVSTDAGGEGINLQFAHVVVNYDLPWNPMRIEQRIGRVDRIGQRHPVRAFNLVMENSVDAYVLQVLEEKLWRILEELGTDKWGDVLESASRGVEDLYAEAITEPDELERETGSLADRTKEAIAASETVREMLGTDAATEKRGGSEEDPGHWLELAREAWRRFRGEAVPDGVRLLDRLPEAVTGEPLPLLRGFPRGMWSLWEVRPDGNGSVRDCFAVFTDDRGASRPDLAETIWLKLAEGTSVEAAGPLTAEEWQAVWASGVDFGYGPCRDLLPPERWNAPWLVPRLVIRIEP
jgi:superfamily II DNA or RNA helicase